ncbi:MAG: hypothetical protein ACKOB3_02650 [Holophagaceae bacterium]
MKEANCFSNSIVSQTTFVVIVVASIVACFLCRRPRRCMYSLTIFVIVAIVVASIVACFPCRRHRRCMFLEGIHRHRHHR